MKKSSIMMPLTSILLLVATPKIVSPLNSIYQVTQDNIETGKKYINNKPLIQFDDQSLVSYFDINNSKTSNFYYQKYVLPALQELYQEVQYPTKMALPFIASNVVKRLMENGYTPKKKKFAVVEKEQECSNDDAAVILGIETKKNPLITINNPKVTYEQTFRKAVTEAKEALKSNIYTVADSTDNYAKLFSKRYTTKEGYIHSAILDCITNPGYARKTTLSEIEHLTRGRPNYYTPNYTLPPNLQGEYDTLLSIYSRMSYEMDGFDAPDYPAPIAYNQQPGQQNDTNIANKTISKGAQGIKSFIDGDFIDSLKNKAGKAISNVTDSLKNAKITQNKTSSKNTSVKANQTSKRGNRNRL